MNRNTAQQIRQHKAMMQQMRQSKGKTQFVYSYCMYRFSKAGSAKHAAEWKRLAEIAGQYSHD